MNIAMNHRNWYKTVGLLFALLAISSEAAAYRYFKCDGVTARWPGSLGPFTMMPMYASPNSFPEGPWREALEKSFERFNENPSDLKLAFKGYGAASSVFGDGINKILGSKNEAYWEYHDYPLAHARVNLECYYISNVFVSFIAESDIVVNYLPWYISSFTKSEKASDLGAYAHEAGSDWNGVPYGYPPSMGKLPFGGTLLHELGHAAGLLHENRFYSTMGLSQSHLHARSIFAYPYLGADDTAGLLGLYGKAFFTQRDLSVVHFKYNDKWWYDDEYAHHRKTALFDDEGHLVDASTMFSDPSLAKYKTYQVEPGDDFFTEFTYENLGNHDVSDLPVRLYVSTDKIIDSLDTKLGDTELFMAAGKQFTAKIKVSLPQWLSRDKNYWIGVYVDPSNVISESRENNNTSYLQIHTNP